MEAAEFKKIESSPGLSGIIIKLFANCIKGKQHHEKQKLTTESRRN
jgi:hypothetical protein